MYKGKKFNTMKEDVLGEDYLGIRKFRFYFKCVGCSSRYAIKTDPKNSDYEVEAGAKRLFDPWKEKGRQDEEDRAERDDETDADAMKSLEYRTLDSKRQMDMQDAVDEIRAMNQLSSKYSADDLIKLHQNKDQPPTEMTDDDVARIQEEFQARKGSTRRLEDDDDDASQLASAASVPVQASAAALLGSSASMPPPSSSATLGGLSKLRTVVKRKRIADSVDAENSSKTKQRPSQARPAAAASASTVPAESQPAADTPPAASGLGLLGEYGSSSDSDSA